jgi:alcohol dehydrogenase class IV
MALDADSRRSVVNGRSRWTLRDGERLIVYGGIPADIGTVLADRGFGEYALITTERASSSVPGLAEQARIVAFAEPGPVIDVATALRGQVAGHPLVALGGGRVIDAAKAIGALERAQRPEGVAAVPTTLSGAELTPIHRQLPGTEGRSIRPSVVICAAALMASQPMPELAASAMNALAHACEARWNANGNPLTDAIAERGARLLCDGLRTDAPDRETLALGAVQAAYSFGLVGTGVHHIVCQTIVRALATPHAATNAVILPHSFALMARLEPAAAAALGDALGRDGETCVRATAARAGVTRLRKLGHSLDDYRTLVPAMLERPDLARNPGVTAADLAALIEAAW